jgi:subfamily B ATP-binding cassette protein MsbA
MLDEGSIIIDGIDINNLAITDLRYLFSVVNQHPILFHDTVIANIAMSEDYDLKLVKEAAVKANASKFITNLSGGYDTVIGAEGMKLSGGERQRICLARAIYRNAPIVILDEATSSVDAQSEQYILEAMKEVLSDKTAIIIAHKLSTVQRADKIFVLEGGKILRTGTHTELLDGDTSDHYQKIVALQTVN